MNDRLNFDYLRLRGLYGDCYRRALQLDLLPIVSPLPKTLDGGEEYGLLKILNIDASRLSPNEKERLVEWIWRLGDNPDRDAVLPNVEQNKATYLVNEDDKSEIIHHDPAAWG